MVGSENILREEEGINCAMKDLNSIAYEDCWDFPIEEYHFPLSEQRRSIFAILGISELEFEEALNKDLAYRKAKEDLFQRVISLKQKLETLVNKYQRDVKVKVLVAVVRRSVIMYRRGRGRAYRSLARSSSCKSASNQDDDGGSDSSDSSDPPERRYHPHVIPKINQLNKSPLAVAVSSRQMSRGFEEAVAV